MSFRGNPTSAPGAVRHSPSEPELAAAVLIALHRLVKQATLYDDDHEAQGPALQGAQSAVANYGRKVGSNPKIYFAERAVYVGRKLLRAGRMTYDIALELGSVFRRFGIDEIAIGYDVSIDELKLFQRAIAHALRNADQPPQHQRYSRIRLRKGRSPEQQRDELERLMPYDRLVRRYCTAIVVVRRCLAGLQQGSYEGHHPLRRVAEMLVEIGSERAPELLAGLTLNNARSEHAGRAVNSALLALAMLRQVGAERRTLARTAMAALLYDFATPRVAGSDPTGEERSGAILPRVGIEQEGELPAASLVVNTVFGGLSAAMLASAMITYEALSLNHGEPHAPAYGGAEEVTLEARIVALARRFTELVADPVEERTPDQAFTELASSLSDEADRTVFRLLIAALGIFPSGTVIELSSGHSAVVIEVPADPRHFASPIVVPVLDSRGARVNANAIDMQRAKAAGLSIVRVLAVGEHLLATEARGGGADHAADHSAEPEHHGEAFYDHEGGDEAHGQLVGDSPVIEEYHYGGPLYDAHPPADHGGPLYDAHDQADHGDSLYDAHAQADHDGVAEGGYYGQGAYANEVPHPADANVFAAESDELLAAGAPSHEPLHDGLAYGDVPRSDRAYAAGDQQDDDALYNHEEARFEHAPYLSAFSEGARDSHAAPSDTPSSHAAGASTPPSERPPPASVRPPRASEGPVSAARTSPPAPAIAVSAAPRAASEPAPRDEAAALAPPIRTAPVTATPIGRPPIGTTPIGRPPISTTPIATKPISTAPIATKPSAASAPLRTHPRPTAPPPVAEHAAEAPSALEHSALEHSAQEHSAQDFSVQATSDGAALEQHDETPSLLRRAIAPPTRRQGAAEAAGPNAPAAGRTAAGGGSSPGRPSPAATRSLPRRQKLTVDWFRDATTDLQPTATGNFAKTPLLNLLVFMLDRKLSGTTAFFAPGNAIHMLYFDRGAPRKIRNSGTVWPLDRVLIEMGLISEQELQATMAESAKTGELHGHLLVEQGKLTEAELEGALSWQLMRKVEFLLRLPEQTTYAYFANLDLLPNQGDAGLVSVDPLALVMIGVRLRERDPSVEQIVSRMQSVPIPLHPQADLTRFGLKEQERKVVDLMRKKPRSLTALIDADVAPAQTVKRLVYALAITRHLHFRGETRPPMGHDVEVRTPPLPPPRTKVGHVAPHPNEPTAAARPAEPAPAAPPPRRPAPPARPAEPAAAAPPPRRPAPPATAAAPQPAARGARVPPSPPTPPPKAPSGITAEEIDERHAELDDLDHFQLLGVDESSPLDVVQSAYFALAKVWHPDRLAPDLHERRAQVARIFSRINEAFQTLSDPTRRSAYIEQVRLGGGTGREREVLERAVDSAMLFQKAEVLFKKGALAQAESMMQKAVDADPQPEYVAFLAWVQASRMSDPPTPAERVEKLAPQIRALDRVIKQVPEYERAIFYRAELYKRAGMMDRAIRDFRRCCELNPRNIDAAREVRLFLKRKEKSTSGLFNRLFKK